MLTQLAKNEEYLLINSVRNRYKKFYNLELSDFEICNICFEMEKNKLVSINDQLLVPTELGIKKGHDLHIEHYFSEGVKKGQS